MDGVIVDVSESYRETVRQTARLFFAGAVSWAALPDPMFTLGELSKVKQNGGLNNDWDLTCCVIELLCSQVSHPEIPNRADTRADFWNRFKKAIALLDVGELAAYLIAHRYPLTRLLEALGRVEDPWVRSFFTGDVGTGNIIKQMFQEIYLGKNLFQSTYGIQPIVQVDEGLINNETLLLGGAAIRDLASENLLAIATGRPRNEAAYPLNRFKIKDCFRRVYTHDDCVRAEADIHRKQGKHAFLGKPNPFMLDAIASDISDPVHRYYYIGDMPDDMVAARRSRFAYEGVGVTFSAEDREGLKNALLRSGAVHIANDVEELKAILKSDGPGYDH